MRASKTIDIGEVFLVPLENRELMPIQVIALREKQSLSDCALIGKTFRSSQDAREAIPLLSSGDLLQL